MSADDNLRDALIEAFNDNEANLLAASLNGDMSGFADIALGVIKDWTAKPNIPVFIQDRKTGRMVRVHED